MLGLIISLFKNYKKFFTYAIGVVILCVALFGGYVYITNSYYEDGIAYQKQVNEKEQMNLKELYHEKQKEKDVQINELNDKINTLNKNNTKNITDLERKMSKLKDEVNEYEKGNNASKLCLDSGWLHIYQNSLPN